MLKYIQDNNKDMALYVSMCKQGRQKDSASVQ